MVERSSSMPPRMEGNPFWSERAQEEHQIQLARPDELPPQNGSPQEVHEAVVDENPNRESQGIRSEERERSRDRKRDIVGKGRGQKPEFSTPPSSWTVRNLSNGQGSVSRTVLEGRDAGDENMSLQRELEKEMCEYLQGENQRLKMEIETLRMQKELQKEMDEKRKRDMEKERKELQDRIEQVRKTQSSTWSEVSHGSGDGPFPPPSTPRQRSFWKTPEEARFTPQGTRVPDGPPPEVVVPEVPVPPSWMLEGRGVYGGDRVFAEWHGRHGGDRAEHPRDNAQHGDRAPSAWHGEHGRDRAEHG